MLQVTAVPCRRKAYSRSCGQRRTTSLVFGSAQQPGRGFCNSLGRRKDYRSSRGLTCFPLVRDLACHSEPCVGRPPPRPLCRLFAVEILWPRAAGFQFREPIAPSWSLVHRTRRGALGRLHLGIRPKRAWNPCPDRSATRARSSRSVPLRAEPDVLERDNDRAGRTTPDALAGPAGVLGDLVRSSELVCDRVRGTDPASPIWGILRAIQPNRRALDTAIALPQTEHLSNGS